MIDPRWIRDASDHLAIEQGCTFDEQAGQLVCDFIETFCRQSKGKWAGRPIALLAWQRDLIMRLFGWKRADGRRRYRRAYIEVAKKNGKSTLVSALAIVLTLIDNEGAPEIYLNACDRSQARIVFDEAARMVRSSPVLSARLETIDTRNRILWREGNGVIIANSAVAPSKDGLNPSGCIFDELHRQPNASLWDVFEYASAAREQPLTISITTAGEEESGVWFEQRDYSERVIRGEIPDTTHLGVIYRADPKDDIDSPETWLKANPSLGETINGDDFARELAEAKQTPRKLAGFKRLRLNIVTKVDTAFFDPSEWKACAADGFDTIAMRGRPLYIGGDLSTTTDLTACFAVWYADDGTFDCKPWFWMPEDRVLELAQRDRVPYQHWIDAGWLHTTPGPVVDYEAFRVVANDLAGDHDLKKILMDPHNATHLVSQLQDLDGLPVEFIRQGYLSMSPPLKELERLIKRRKIRHDGNPLMAWMVSNAIVETDAAGNIKLSKAKSRKKIDGPAALVNALAGAVSEVGEAGSIYDHEGIFLL